MSTETTKIIFTLLQPNQTELVLPSGFQVQVVDSLTEIACSPAHIVKKFQYAALVREERILLVWHDELDQILVHAEDIEGKLLAFVSDFPCSCGWFVCKKVTDSGYARYVEGLAPYSLLQTPTVSFAIHLSHLLRAQLVNSWERGIRKQTPLLILRLFNNRLRSPVHPTKKQRNQSSR